MQGYEEWIELQQEKDFREEEADAIQEQAYIDSIEEENTKLKEQNKVLREALDVTMKAITDIYNLSEVNSIKYIQKVDSIACDTMTEIGEINEQQALKQTEENKI